MSTWQKTNDVDFFDRRRTFADWEWTRRRACTEHSQRWVYTFDAVKRFDTLSHAS